VRANPAYRLIPWLQLPERDRRFLARVMGSPSPFVLLPQATDGLHAKAVDEDAARLIRELTEPAPVPGFFFDGACSERRLQQLVLDSVLEVECGGKFVSGPSSIDLVAGPAPRAEARDRLSQLSLAALRYAATLPIADCRLLSSRLYTYNTVPSGPRWRRAYPETDSVRNALGLGERGAQRAMLVEVYDEVDSPHWLVWRRYDAKPVMRLARKLYVSPQPEDLLVVFPRVIDAFLLHCVPSFKVGRDLHGILRPDKLVAYFADARSMEGTAADLRAALDGCRAQGVPFSAALDPGGLLSWGRDPPPEEQLPGWTYGESWRLWITNQLALALLHAKRSGSAIEPWQYAIRRLDVEGVDTVLWAPTGSLWY